ncbi:MAG: ornithine carbamoyltransferase [Patescibacteria group bacterium]
MHKSLTKITDLTPEEVELILKKAFEFKTQKDNGLQSENLLHGKVVAMVFEKQSLRTRVAFETATISLGGFPIFLPEAQIISGAENGPRESISDITKNLERFSDLLIARVYKHETILEMASSTNKPIINALCDLHHPTQALADLMAIKWHKHGSLGDLKVTFIGDGNNVATSLMHICAMMGINFAIASPAGYAISKDEQYIGAQLADKHKTTLEFLESPQDAVKNADVVYTDTFVSMGQEAETVKRLKDFRDYQINGQLLGEASKDAIFMHCLPAHRGQEVTDEVISGPQSIVFDEAECRLHIAKALLYFYLCNEL